MSRRMPPGGRGGLGPWVPLGRGWGLPLASVAPLLHPFGVYLHFDLKPIRATSNHFFVATARKKVDNEKNLSSRHLRCASQHSRKVKVVLVEKIRKKSLIQNTETQLLLSIKGNNYCR